MIIFEDSNISPEKSVEENMRLLKSYLGDLTDKLNMLSEQVENNKKLIDEIESEEE